MVRLVVAVLQQLVGELGEALILPLRQLEQFDRRHSDLIGRYVVSVPALRKLDNNINNFMVNVNI